MDAAAQAVISVDEVVNEKSWWIMFREKLEPYIFSKVYYVRFGTAIQSTSQPVDRSEEHHTLLGCPSSFCKKSARCQAESARKEF